MPMMTTAAAWLWLLNSSRCAEALPAIWEGEPSVTPDRIDPVRPPYLRPIDSSNTPRQRTSEANAPRPIRNADSVELSPEARLLGQLAATDKADRPALIERLRAEIANGDYKLDPETIARVLNDSGDLDHA